MKFCRQCHNMLYITMKWSVESSPEPTEEEDDEKKKKTGGARDDDVDDDASAETRPQEEIEAEKPTETDTTETPTPPPPPSSTKKRMELVYNCKHCGFEATASQLGGSASEAVLSTNYADDQTTYKQYVTPHLRHDPTLPRASDIECINGPNCTRPPEDKREVIYVKYDSHKLKYLYHCVHCSAYWRSGGSAVKV